MGARQPATGPLATRKNAAEPAAPRALSIQTRSRELDPDAAQLVARLTADQAVGLATYRDLLLEWNQRFNLTALSDPDVVERRLFLDALRMLPVIDESLGEVTTARLVDIGTGAGFPGLVLAVTRPELDVTLIEATGKKVSFLQTVIETLGLANVAAIHARAEDVARDPAHREQYDLATARAVASLPALIELAMPFLRIDGRALFPKSAALGEELAQGRRAAEIVGARIITPDPQPQAESDGVTRLVIAAKIRGTPTRYPRRAGIPAREPLGRDLP
jgi:16S rRNA (guanine527-N7)-methyltransferase